MIEVESPIIDEKFGSWRLSAGRFETVEAASSGRTVVYVPTEDVALFVVDLPLSSRTQRLAAAPFAIEEKLAQPLESMHVALGPETSPRRHVVAAVALSRMVDWIDQITAFGLYKAALTPDVFRLTAPPAEMWSIEVQGTRALVRAGDGVGFAIPSSLLTDTWEAAGQPRIFSAFGPLPAPLAAGADIILERRPEGEAPVDLRQGLFAVRRPAHGAVLKVLAAVLLIGVAAHVLIAAVDVMALKRIAAKRHAEAFAMLTQVSPGLTPTEDLASALDDILPSASAQAPGPFIPLLTRAATALEPMSSSITLRSLSYEDRALGLKVEAADIPALQRVETAISGSGLATSRGGATTEAGKATGDIIVRLTDGAGR